MGTIKYRNSMGLTVNLGKLDLNYYLGNFIDVQI